MIRSLRVKVAELVLRGEYAKGFPANLMKTARRKLEILNAAESLNDLKSPPANRLEFLKADRAGQHSIRINDQYRICFKWTPEGPHEVEIVDYH